MFNLKGISSWVEGLVKFDPEEFLTPNLYTTNGMRRYYLMNNNLAKHLMKELNYTPLSKRKWEKVPVLARSSDNGTFTPPKHPIRINKDTLEVEQGVLRLHALAETRKPSVVWVEFV